MASYADIILPLPIVGTFTYSIPAEMGADVVKGHRVIVQFGRKKYYTGVVASVHDRKPVGYDVKPILMTLDTAPIVRYPQLRFWEWIADYYLCTVGEVCRAALPTGLKIESETVVALNPDFEASDVKLTERQVAVLQALDHHGPLRLDVLERESEVKNIGVVVNKLMELGAVVVDEKSVNKYRARKETYVRLLIERGDGDALHELFDRVSRARLQERLLIAWLDASGWMKQSEPLREVPRTELLANAGVSPAILKAMADKGIFEVYKKEINRFSLPVADEDIRLSPLSENQEKALYDLRSQMRDHDVTLLHGVTGSGKTEIYTHLISQVLERGDQVLYLVPEIALTTQLTDRLRRCFGKKLLVWHSKFTDNERVDIWKRLLTSHEPLVVLGVRSSVFLPFARLGLVVVDEEHESSYKQYDPAPRYNARDAAIVLAMMHGAKTLLGSATPSIETYYKATTGKYGLVNLEGRYGGSVLPDVEIVDMREQRKKHLNSGILSAPLRLATDHALKEERQAIMFQNRRGFAPMVQCRECAWTPKCVNCDVSLVFHKRDRMLRCHYCGYALMLPNVCPACGQPSIETFGYGTERIAEEIHKLFPDHRTVRMDLDTTRSRDAYQEIIEEFSRKDTDILVGTQMVSKGLDFEHVSVVGVLSADLLLNFPDFRSNERAFNMLEQVAGRAGRRADRGSVVIQTTDPSNPVLDFVKRHDYRGFYAYEIGERQRFAYPPFTRIINIMVKHRDDATAYRLATELAGRLRAVFGQRVLGPERPFVSRVSNYYLQGIMLKVEAGASMKKVKALVRRVYEEMAADPTIKSAQIHYDVDPV